MAGTDLSMNIASIDIPEYRVDTEPDFKAVGKKLDDWIKQNYPGQRIAIRALSSDEHQDLSHEELVEIIKKDGSDRYDNSRKGDRYENIEGKHIDLFALPIDPVQEDSEMFEHMLRSFYRWPLKERGYPVRIDIVIIYDLNRLEEVEHRYEGRDDIKRDGFVFKNPNNRPEAILGILLID